MRANLLRVTWILVQGLFLPLILWLNDLREAGNLWAIGIFALLEGLYLIDALLFLRIFKGGKDG